MPKNDQPSTRSVGNLALSDGRGAERGPRLPSAPAAHEEDRTDYQALLDWQRRGMPENEIPYTSDAPKTTKEQWKDAETVEARFSRRRR